jgi:hypothetical protein
MQRVAEFGKDQKGVVDWHGWQGFGMKGWTWNTPPPPSEGAPNVSVFCADQPHTGLIQDWEDHKTRSVTMQDYGVNPLLVRGMAADNYFAKQPWTAEDDQLISYRGYATTFPDSSCVVHMSGEFLITDAAGDTLAPAWVDVPDSLMMRTSVHVETATRTVPFLAPPIATISWMDVLMYSDSVRPVWGIGQGNQLRYFVELVDAATDEVLQPLGMQTVIGCNSPGTPPPSPPQPLIHSAGLMAPPGLPVRIRVRSQLLRPASESHALICFHSDSLLSVLLAPQGIGKLPALRRIGALPIIEVLYPFPNPSSDGLNRFLYNVYDPGTVSITVSDLVAKYRTTLVNEITVPGRYWGSFNTSGLSPGVYLIEQRVNGMLTGRGVVMVMR